MDQVLHEAGDQTMSSTRARGTSSTHSYGYAVSQSMQCTESLDPWDQWKTSSSWRYPCIHPRPFRGCRDHGNHGMALDGYMDTSMKTMSSIGPMDPVTQYTACSGSLRSHSYVCYWSLLPSYYSWSGLQPHGVLGPLDLSVSRHSPSL